MSDLYKVLALIFWVPKMLGSLVSILDWWYMPVAALIWWSQGNTHDAQLALCFYSAWWLIYFKGICVLHRWFSEIAVSYALGLPVPLRPVRLSGRPGFARARTGVVQSIHWASFDYATIHPSEDGNNDLGQTWPLTREEANDLQNGLYQEHYVYLGEMGCRCHRCNRRCGGGRRCRGCGTYIDENGRIDVAANLDYVDACTSASPRRLFELPHFSQ